MYRDTKTGVKTYDQQEAIRYYERGHSIVVVDYKRNTGKETTLAVWETPVTTLKRKKIEKNFHKTLDKFLKVW
jgi:hypothetical protein